MAKAVVSSTNERRIKDILWRSAGKKTVREIAEETGLTPEEVLIRKREMFEELDVLTVEQERMRLMVSLNEMIDLAMDNARESSDPRNHAGMINAAVGAIDKSLKQVKLMEERDSTRVDSLNALRVRELLRLIDAVVVSSVAEISEQHGLDADELMDVFSRRIHHEAAALDTEVFS